MLTKCKISIHTDVMFIPSSSHYHVLAGKYYYEPAHWVVVLSRESQEEHNYGLPYVRYYNFVTKPTRKQISEVRHSFKVCYDMYEHY
ncbi:hypothetical protein [Klebsiella phage 05F01]|nr:hypothetical protein [Klebsiella phage 05F01]